MHWKSVLCLIVILWKHYGSITFIVAFIQSSKIVELYTVMDTVLTNNPSRYSNTPITLDPLLSYIVPHRCVRHMHAILLLRKQNYHEFVTDVISLYVSTHKTVVEKEKENRNDVLEMNDVLEPKQWQEKKGDGFWKNTFLHTTLASNSRFLYQFIISGKYVANLPDAIHLEYVTLVHSFQKTISKQIIEIDATCKQVQLEFTYLYKLVMQYFSLCTYTFFFLVYVFQNEYIHSLCSLQPTKRLKIRSIGKDFRSSNDRNNLCIGQHIDELLNVHETKIVNVHTTYRY